MCVCVLTGVSCFVWVEENIGLVVRWLDSFYSGYFLVWDEFDGDVKIGIVLFLASVFPCFGDKVWDVFIFFR